jgi:predicted metal-dependent hydrolase
METTILKYTVIERKVKRVRVEVKFGEVFVVIPVGKLEMAEVIVKQYGSWILDKLAAWEKNAGAESDIILEERTHWDTQVLVERLVNEGARVINKPVAKISFRNMKRRWGSCSSRGELVFNWNLRFLPERLVWYVVWHELCHLRVQSHDARFKALMRTEFSDLRSFDRELSAYFQRIYGKGLK